MGVFFRKAVERRVDEIRLRGDACLQRSVAVVGEENVVVVVVKFLSLIAVDSRYIVVVDANSFSSFLQSRSDGAKKLQDNPDF